MKTPAWTPLTCRERSFALASMRKHSAPFFSSAATPSPKEACNQKQRDRAQTSNISAHVEGQNHAHRAKHQPCRSHPANPSAPEWQPRWTSTGGTHGPRKRPKLPPPDRSCPLRYLRNTSTLSIGFPLLLQSPELVHNQLPPRVCFSINPWE